MKNMGRNDPCSCGSGKKFKKCCERLMIGGRHRAERVGAGSAPQIQKTIAMTSLFQSCLAATPKKPLPPEPAPLDPLQLDPEPIAELEKKACDLIV